MNLELNDKIAIVAAASKGFGRAAARALAAEGARVAMCARTVETLQAAADDIAAETGTETLPIVADVTKSADCERVVEQTVTRWGTVHVLVTNSGGPTPGDFDAVDDAAWQSAFESTLLNVVRLIRLCLPHMKKQRWGRIVNIQSISIRQPVDGLLLSNSIRPGCAGLTRSLATELGPYNILINTLCPGSHETDRIHELAEVRAAQNGTTPAHELEQLAASIPLKRLGDPAELAAAAVFLCSERASYITGTSLLVDGGACRATI